MPNRMSVASADFIRNIGYWQNEALRRPISITHHGRERLVLAAPEEYRPAQDTSESTAAQAALTSLRFNADTVLENLDEGFLSFDTDLNVTDSNALAEGFVGLSANLLAGAAIFDVMPQPLASVLRDRLSRVLRTRKAESFEAGAFDGRHIAVRVFPLAIGVAALFRNTTEHHELRSQVEEAAALAAALATHPQAACIKLDARARIENVTEAFCDWSGFSRADVIGHRFVDLVSGGQRRDAGEMIERVLREAAPRRTELTLLGKRGQELSGIMSVAPILTDFVAHGVLALMIYGERNLDAIQVA